MSVLSRAATTTAVLALNFFSKGDYESCSGLMNFSSNVEGKGKVTFREKFTVWLELFVCVVNTLG